MQSLRRIALSRSDKPARSGDLRFNNHLGFGATVVADADPLQERCSRSDGIGTPPRLSFFSHGNYINSTNWGVQFGPVLRF